MRQLIYKFCTAQSFRNRSKLTDFYKAIHPDILNNAPDNIKLENSRSLKILNSYFDAVAQNIKTEPQELMFYVPNKTNHKARKFYPITVTLDAYLQKNQNEVLDRVVKQLQDKISQKQEEVSKLHVKKSKFMNITEDDYERVKADLLKESTFIKRVSYEQESDKLARRSLIYSIQNQDRFDKVQASFRQDLRAQNEYIKPQLWSEILLKDSDPIQGLMSIFNDLIDPRMIFLDQKLTESQIDSFKEKVTPKMDQQLHTMHLKEFFQQFNSTGFYLYVTDHYGYQDIPGYFSIPYSFKAEELMHYFGTYHKQIKDAQIEYLREFDRYEQLISSILSKFQISINSEYKIKNLETIKELNLTLLMLQKQLTQVDVNRLRRIREKQWILTDQVTKVEETRETVYVPVPFTSYI